MCSLQDDRIETVTRVLAAVIIPFLVVAAAILLFRPEDTADLFAWPIEPPLTAMVLGSAYLGGAYFFVRVVAERRWHRVTLGFPPVIVFASLLGVATALHWDRYTHGHVSFVAWAVLYFTTPFLVAAAWWHNRRRDPGTLEATGDVVLGPRLAGCSAALGGLACLVGGVLFVSPATVAELWPWTVTPLTGRVVASIFALQGVVALGIFVDRRWSAARIMAQTALVMLGCVAVSTAVRRQDVDTTGWGSLLYPALVLLIVAWAALYVTMERRRRRRPQSPDEHRDLATDPV